MKVQAEGRGLPNLGDRSRLVRMRISDVTDAAGKSLLPLRECGPARNREWVASGHVSEGTRFRDGEVVRFPKISMKKDLVLADNVEAADVAAIRGEIEYQMPTEVRRIRLDAPLAGEVIEDEDVRIRFQSASGRSIRRAQAAVHVGAAALATAGAMGSQSAAVDFIDEGRPNPAARIANPAEPLVHLPGVSRHVSELIDYH